MGDCQNNKRESGFFSGRMDIMNTLDALNKALIEKRGATIVFY
jgi:hypothetical protein